MKSSVFKFCLLACIPFFNVACSTQEKLLDKEFLIEGKISGIEDGTVFALVRWDGNVGSSIAYDTVRSGRFSFKEEALSNPERMTISPQGDGFPSLSLFVWVAPGIKVKIKGKGKMHPLWEVKSSVPYQKEENRYTDKNRNLIAEIAHISTERNAVFPKIMAASSREEALPYMKIVDSLDVISDSLWVIQCVTDVDIMEKTDISPIWIDKLMHVSYKVKKIEPNDEYLGILRRKTENLYAKMSEEEKNTPLGYHITATLFPPPTFGVGDDMPDTDFFDITGNTKHLSDYSGKYLLLDFWSSGCGPCIMSIPEMKEIAEAYDENLTIISISLDTDTRWKKALATHDMPWVNIRDPKGYGGLAANYGVNGIPHYVLISPENIIVDIWGGFGQGNLKRKVGENVK